MYSARTPLVLVLLMGGLMEIASAQHKYIFPQFAFGGGWESTLMVQAVDNNATCNFSAQGRFFTMLDPPGNSLSGTQQQLVLGMNEGTILKTATPQGMVTSSGMAVLDCSEEVSANTLFSLEVGGSLVAEAVVEPSEEIVSGAVLAQFLADHRDGARFGVAVANPSNQPLDVLIAVGDLGGQQIGEAMVNVPANTAQARFVDELVTIPTGHTGQVSIRPSNNPGPSAYVVGLRVTGLVITTIPAIGLRLTSPGGGTDDGPRTTYGSGTWLVNEEIAPGRYFTNPLSGCYWERLSGTGGSTADILANEFINFDSGQEIVDVASSDYAFKPDSECGTWSQTPVSAPSSGIPPGRWLVGRQIPAGTYETNASSSCYWERLSGFSGDSRDIIANDFVAAPGRQIVTISLSDEGLYSDADCGTWSRLTGSTLTTSTPAGGSEFSGGLISPAIDRGTIDRNRRMYRAESGLH